VRWGFKVLTRWNGLGDIRNGKHGIFINPKAIMGIIIGVQCWDGPNRLLHFNFSSSSYHSHLLYFVSTSLFTLTLYVNTLYPSFIALTTNYSSSINVHSRPPLSCLHVLSLACGCIYITKAWLTHHQLACIYTIVSYRGCDASDITKFCPSSTWAWIVFVNIIEFLPFRFITPLFIPPYFICSLMFNMFYVFL